MKDQIQKNNGFMSINLTIVVALIAVCVVLGGALWLERQDRKSVEEKYSETKASLKVAEDKLKDITEDNRVLNEQILLKEDMAKEETKLKLEFKEKADRLEKESEKLKNKLPRSVPRLQTDKVDTEQEIRSNKRIQILWEAFCIDGFVTEECPPVVIIPAEPNKETVTSPKEEPVEEIGEK